MTGLWFLFALALPFSTQPFIVIIQGQSMEGFISIDCGRPKEQSYKEYGTGITYISDYEFIDTGVSGVVSDELFYINAPTSYLRSFPNGTRNCYTIKSVMKGLKYLVRARFLYGNYDGKNKFPKFDLYLGINLLGTVNTVNASDYLIIEIIVVVVSNSISICLVNTDNGIPFISAIDLRLIPDDLYLGANTSQSLLLRARQDFGGHRDIRYPDDTYDRYWLTDIHDYNTSRISFSIVPSAFKEPSSVMQSLIFPKNGSDLINIAYPMTFDDGACPPSDAYIILYFAELEKLMLNESRRFSVSSYYVPTIFADIQPEYLKTTTLEKYAPFDFNCTLVFSLSSSFMSTKPPILNALEVYTMFDMNCQSETRTLDVDAITDIKAFYKVKRNWNGDPCAPEDYMWEGLNCTFNGSNSPSITSLDLSSGDLSGAISASFANLTALQYLDLSNNSLTGEIPDFLSGLAELKVLNLANNSLTGSIPKVLLDMSSKGQLNLSTGGNPNLCFNPDSCPEERSKKNNKVLTVVVSCISAVVVLVVLVLIIFVWRCCNRKSTGGNRVEIKSRDGNQIEVEEMRKFKYDEVKEITDDFKEEIGSGGFGRVFLGKFGNKRIAVKVLKKFIKSTKGLEGFRTEAKLLSKIHHRNLVPLIGYCDDDIDHVALVYEYMEGGSLHDHLSGENNTTPLSWRERLRIAWEAAQGLEYLHKGCKPPIIHRDIKPANILLTEKLEVCIADFGLSKMFEDDGVSHMSSTGYAGTPGYLDPEYESTKKLRTKSDIYSFGVVLLNLITGIPATIDGEVIRDIVTWIRSGEDVSKIFDKKIEVDYDANSVLELAKIVKKCTNSRAQERPDIIEVVADLKACFETKSQ